MPCAIQALPPAWRTVLAYGAQDNAGHLAVEVCPESQMKAIRR
jgi:hypothetical protein